MSNFKIRNTNSKGESVLLSPVFDTKKKAWFYANEMASEEALCILEALETVEQQNSLRWSKEGGKIIIKVGKYLENKENYESRYTIERID